MILESTVKKYVGKRYGRITLTAFSRLDPNNKYHYLFFGRCDCGREKEFRISNLQQGNQSCGCYAKERNKIIHTGNQYRRLGYGEAACNNLFARYKQDAAKRKIAFRIAREKFEEITKRNCFYCDAEPIYERRDKNGFGAYKYNGIDRADNAKPYSDENCVACCHKCNSLKNGISREMVRRLYHFLFKK